MTSVAVLIPVLGRPQRVEPLVESIRASEPADVQVVPVFLCSPGDDAEIAACRDQQRAGDAVVHVVDWKPGRGDYAKKMNYGWRQTPDDWVFLGADDLRFRPGWVEECFRVFGETEACVIGTNDLGNRTVMDGRHSTHTLVHRDYEECGSIDDPSVILFEGYWHNWVDNELVETAKWRGTFAAATGAHVEHLHPFWQKGHDDATYERGREHYDEDRQTFQRRRRLWT